MCGSVKRLTKANGKVGPRERCGFRNLGIGGPRTGPQGIVERGERAVRTGLTRARPCCPPHCAPARAIDRPRDQRDPARRGAHAAARGCAGAGAHAGTARARARQRRPAATTWRALVRARAARSTDGGAGAVDRHGCVACAGGRSGGSCHQTGRSAGRAAGRQGGM